MKSSPALPKDRITLATVARLAGVSPSTVSLVLNDRPLSRKLAADTRERIRSAAETLRYHPNAAARSLRSARTHLLGIIVFDIADPYCTLILQGVQEAVRQTDLLPIILDVQNRSERFNSYLDMLVEHRVEGVIIIANWLFIELNGLRAFEDTGIPAVIVGREFVSKSISSVLVDNRAGGCAAMHHLLSLGHTRIAVIRGPKRLQDSDRRWRGIQQAARDAGHTLHSKLVLRLPESADPLQGFVGGHRAIAQLLLTGIHFTGIVAFDDLTACGALRALHEAGIRSPHDVSVVGFDDIPQAVLTTPSLTTVGQGMKEMGSFAAAHVLTLIHADPAKKPAAATIRLHPPTMIVRESTGKSTSGSAVPPGEAVPARAGRNGRAR